MSFKKKMGWLAGHGKRTFSLSPLKFFLTTLGAPMEFYTDHLNRAGRIAERGVTISGAAVLTSLLLPAGGWVIAGGLAIAKAVGIAVGFSVGKVVDGVEKRLDMKEKGLDPKNKLAQAAYGGNEKAVAKLLENDTTMIQKYDLLAQISWARGRSTASQLFKEAAARKQAPKTGTGQAPESRNEKPIP